MTESHEDFFECSSALEGDPRTALVSAWDPEQAEVIFREILAAYGVRDPGEVTVTRLAAGASGLRRESGSPAAPPAGASAD